MRKSSREAFPFNNPFGACPECFGLGYKMEFDEDLMIPDKSLSVSAEGAIAGDGMAVLYRIRPVLPDAILDALCRGIWI